MKKTLWLLIPFSLLLAAPGFGAESGKLRYAAAAYDDAAGVSLRYPEGVACSQDWLYVADTGRSRLVRYSLADRGIKASGVVALSGNVSPLAVQVNSKGDIFVLDGRQQKVMKLSGSGEPKGVLTPGGLPDAGKIVVKSLKVDAKDNIYLLDIFSQRVLVLDPEGQYRRQVPFPKEPGFFSDLAVDGQGMIFLLNSVQAAIYAAGRDAAVFSPLTGPLKDYMNFPVGIATDNKGLIYLTDQYGSGLVLLGHDGKFLGRKIGSGWVEGQLNYPAQLCINPAGHLFIADRNNSRVQMFSGE